VLLTLIVVGAGVLARKFYYGAPIRRATVGGALQPALQAKLPLAALAPSEFSAAGPAEVFDARTLSDRIDGKAEYYLPVGFVSLQCQRFASRQQPGAWVELDVYDMGAMRNAFAVYSLQRRAGVEELDVAPHAYRAGGAVFFVHGRYYVEIIVYEPSDVLAAGALALAGTFVERIAAGPGAHLNELALFPPESLVHGSIELQERDAFGFEGFDRVFLATYRFGDVEAMAYLSRRSDAAEAQRLAEAYARFVQAHGVTAAATGPAETPGASLFVLPEAEVYYFIFHRGPFVGGVDACRDAAVAEELGLSLYESLPQVAQ